MIAPLSLKPHPRSFSHWVRTLNLHDWTNQLSLAFDTICAAANEAGIDWPQLQHQLPVPGTLLKGSELPSLTPEDRGRNAFIWHLNSDRYGGLWACLLFMSFRHGGVHHILHMRRRAWNRFNLTRGLPLSQPGHSSPRIDPARGRNEQAADARRAQRFALASQRWQHGPPASATHELLSRRLYGAADAQLLRRVALRSSRDYLGEHLMLRLQHPHKGHSGFQQLYSRAPDNKGRTQHLVIREAGLKKGSFACIRAMAGHEDWPVAICEGLFTALSVALGWPGPVALDAYNLCHVRSAISRPCVFFADDDCSGVRNTGFAQARAAQQPGDRIILPQFPTGEHSGATSDFNDLHRLCGRAEVQRQIRSAWPVEQHP